MAWIESHQEIAQHPKTLRLARYLGVSIPDAIGRLHLLWWWATNYAADGDLSSFDAEDIASATLWDGDLPLMLDSLKRAGFVDDDGRVHDWQQYAGRLMESRALASSRHVRNQQLYNDYDLVHAVRQRDGSTCRYCGLDVFWKDRKSPRGGTYDHIDPDGPNTVDNIVVSCRGCNGGKGRRTPQQARMVLLPAPIRQISTGNLPDPVDSSRNNLLTVPNSTSTGPEDAKELEGPEAVGAAAPPAPADESLDRVNQTLTGQPGYALSPEQLRKLGGIATGQHLDFELEALKIVDWFKSPKGKGRQCSFRFVANWLESGARPPPAYAPTPATNGTGPKPRGISRAKHH